MVFAIEKSNNKNYTFCEMLKEDDTSNFIMTITKEIQDHESWGQWEIINQYEIPKDTKTIQAI